MQGIYSVPFDQDITKGDAESFYAMLDVNRCLYLTSESY